MLTASSLETKSQNPAEATITNLSLGVNGREYTVGSALRAALAMGSSPMYPTPLGTATLGSLR